MGTVYIASGDLDIWTLLQAHLVLLIHSLSVSPTDCRCTTTRSLAGVTIDLRTAPLQLQYSPNCLDHWVHSQIPSGAARSSVSFPQISSPFLLSLLNRMCGCTLYDSPTCGHSWISMSQPCGFLSDLLSCPNRQTYQTLIAPPYACPTCNRGFADRETIEMVQGPWGCNQLIRSHVGGSYAIPGQWGNAPMHMMPGGWGGPTLTSGAMMPMHNYGYDHRLTGPCPPPPPMMCDRPMLYDGYDTFDDGFMYDFDFDDRRKRRKHKSSRYHEYRWSSKPATNCAVM
jgi:hypothetical protein